MADITLPKQEDFPAAFSSPPELVHRGYAGLADFPNSNAVKQADATLGFVSDTLAADNELRISRNPQDTLAAHASKLKQQVGRASQERAKRLDATKAAIKAERAAIDAELQRAAGLKANDKHFDAIVDTFRAFRAEQRAAELDALVEQADGPTLAALIEAPLVVTGLSSDQRDSIKQRLYEKVSPGSLALLNHLGKLLRHFEAASLPRMEAEQKLVAGTDAFDGKVRAAEAVAAKAQASLLN